MKVLTLLPLLLPAVLAAPAGDEQSLFNIVMDNSDLTGVFGGIVKSVEHLVLGAEKEVEKQVEQWMEGGKEFVKQNGLICKPVARIFAGVRLISSRIQQTSLSRTLCSLSIG